MTVSIPEEPGRVNAADLALELPAVAA